MATHGTRRSPGLGTWLAAGAVLGAILLLLFGIGNALQAPPGSDRQGPVAASAEGDPVEDGGTSDGSGGGGGADIGSGDSGSGSGQPGDQDADGQPTADGDATAPLSFLLDLEGAVPYADRFSVHYAVNGEWEVYGLCGFSEESRCRNDRLYSFSVPAVPVGASVEWYFSWFGSSDFNFGGGSTSSHDGTSVDYRCTFQGPTTGNTKPSCQPSL